MAGWSETLGKKAHAEDITQGLGDALCEAVHDQATQDGIMLTSDCPHCGLQWKGKVSWGEVVMMHAQQVPQVSQGQAPPWVATRQGIVMNLKCRRCAGNPGRTVFKVVVRWDEIGQWVEIGVRSNAISRRSAPVRR